MRGQDFHWLFADYNDRDNNRSLFGQRQEWPQKRNDNDYQSISSYNLPPWCSRHAISYICPCARAVGV
jgi:hypothetical protein